MNLEEMWLDPHNGAKQECQICGKITWPSTHSCSGVPRTEAAMKRYLDRNALKSTLEVPQELNLTVVSDFIHGTERVLKFVYSPPSWEAGHTVVDIWIRAGYIDIRQPVVLPLDELKYLTMIATTV